MNKPEFVRISPVMEMNEGSFITYFPEVSGLDIEAGLAYELTRQTD